MSERVVWDKYETALLIDMFWKIENEEISKAEGVQQLSQQLRRMAINQGRIIDDVYRNRNGMILQMSAVEKLFFPDRKCLKEASRLFVEMVEVYNSQRSVFNVVLSEAKEMAQEVKSNNRNKFVEWLTEKGVKVPPVDLIISAFDSASEYILKRNISKKSFWEMQLSTEYNFIRAKLLGMKFFRMLHPNIAKTLDKSWRYYSSFLDDIKIKSEEFLVANDDSKEVVIIEDTSSETFLNEVTKSRVTERESDSDNLPKDELLERFGEWMNNKGIAEATIRSYVSAINVADNYAKENNLQNASLISSDPTVIINSIEILLSNKQFIEFNQRQHNRFSAAFRKLRDFISETERFASKDSADAELEIKHPDLYNKLYTMSKVYVGDPNGLSVEQIAIIFGYPQDQILEILDNVSWAKKKSDGIYIFGTFDVKIEITVDKKPIYVKEFNDFSKERFIEVLLNRFRNGMLFDSIDYDNFREVYFDLFDEKLALTDEELEVRLKICGLEYNGRLFPAEGIIDSATSEKVFAYIENTFAMGSKLLYYKAIYSDLSDILEYCYSLVDVDMFKAYLKYQADPGKYYFFDQYMSKEKNVKVDNAAEIAEFMLNAGKPLSYDEVYEGLSHISQDIIHTEIRSNPKYIMNEKEHYFHIDIFEFSSTDREKFTGLFNDEIEENGYVIWSRMYSYVAETMPAFIENNTYLSFLGIRNALSYHMNTEFAFDGNVISSITNKLDMSEVFRLYAKQNVPFTADDIYNFAKEVGTQVVYFWAIADVSVRVSNELFVAKDAVHFDIDAVDAALETYLSHGYILIKDVDSFLVFPFVGFEWNEYLLESYLLHYSKKFCLVNNGISLNNVAGAITKKDGEYTQFVDICSHAIAESDIELKKAPALEFLVDVNLLTKKSYKEIDVVLNKARQLRNKRG